MKMKLRGVMFNRCKVENCIYSKLPDKFTYYCTSDNKCKNRERKDNYVS